MGVIFLAQGFHVLHVSDGLYCELPTPTLTSILDSREPFSYLYSWWLNLTLISVIYVDLLLKMCPISSLPDRQSQYNVSFFSTDLCCACSVGAASWIHCLKQMPVVDFDLFIPPLNAHALKVSTGPVLGVGYVCVCVCVSYCVCVLHVLRWCQLYSVSKDRCAEDRLCQEHRRSEETLC